MTDVAVCPSCGNHTALTPSPAGPSVCEVCMPKFSTPPEPPPVDEVSQDDDPTQEAPAEEPTTGEQATDTEAAPKDPPAATGPTPSTRSGMPF